MPFLILWETLLSMIMGISNFIGPLVECRVWFPWFHTYRNVSQSFLIKAYIQLLSVILNPIDRRWIFCISSQFDAVSPMKDWIHPMFYWFSNSLATGRVIEGGGVGSWTFSMLVFNAVFLRAVGGVIYWFRPICERFSGVYPTWRLLLVIGTHEWCLLIVGRILLGVFQRARNLIFTWWFL